MSEGLDHLLAVDHLFDITIQTGYVLLLGSEVASGKTGNTGTDQEDDDDHQDRQYGQIGREDDHVDEDGHDLEDSLEERGDGLRDQLTHGVDIVGIDRHDLAVGMGIEVTDRQGLHLIEEIDAQIAQTALRDGDHQPLLDIGCQDPDPVKHGHPADTSGQRSEVLDLRTDQGRDVGIDQGTGEHRALNAGQDADHDTDQDHQIMEPVTFKDELQDAAKGLPGVFDLDALHLSSGRHPYSPPSSKSALLPV